MSRTRLSLVGLLVAATVIVSCTDRPGPTEVTRPFAKGGKSVAGTCTTVGALKTLATTTFGARNQYLHDALDNISDIGEYVAENHISDAQKKAKSLTLFIQKHASTFANPSQAQTLIDAISCYAGLTTDTFLVYPSDAPQTIVTTNGQAGILLPANPVSQPTLITITVLDTTTSPLITKLDKYPGYIEVTQQSGVANSLVGPVTVAVCPVAGIPDSIASRLRLGHQKAPGATGFEVTPYVNASFLTCAGYASAASKLPGWARALASLIMPKPLYARMTFSGGVGGTAEEFSPFGPVDPVLSFSGGVGGTAEEFMREQPVSPEAGKKRPEATEQAVQGKLRVRSLTETVVGVTTCYQAVVGASAQPTGCRPSVTLKTANGTAFTNVPVTFTVGATGGQVAIDNPAGAGNDCGAFGSSAGAATDTGGVARACWTLGDIAADYTVTATPSLGGDAIDGVRFSRAAYTWTVTAVKKVATLTLGNLAATYSGSPIAATVTSNATGASTFSFTYDGLPTAPTNAGSYAVVANLDNPSFTGSASGTLVISPATATVTLGDLTPTYTGAPLAASATTSATGASTFSFTYDGSPTAPTAVGNYAVVGTLSNANFTGSASGTLVISPAVATVTLGDLTPTYTGAPLAASATTDATGASTFSFTYDGAPTAPTNAGTYAVVGTLSNANFTGSASGTLVIGKATATLSLVIPAASYDGAMKSATVTTSPSGLGTVAITYGGSGTAPTNAGSYAVVATLTNTNYAAATASGTLTITQAPQAISFSTLLTRTYGEAAFGISATGGASGNLVSFSVGAGSTCTLLGSTVTLTGAGTCALIASQNGSANYTAAPAVAQTITINKKLATATAGSGSKLIGATNPALPCVVSGLLAADAGTVTCTTSVPATLVSGANTTTPVVSPSSPTNYTMGLVNGTLTVTGYVQQGCFASPINNSVNPPPTSTGINRPSTITVKCRLVEPSGRPIVTAKGNLLVQEKGTNGLGTAVTKFSGTNVFTVSDDDDFDSDDGFYTYKLSTSAYTKGRYYLITATWNDGSTTKGWVYFKP